MGAIVGDMVGSELAGDWVGAHVTPQHVVPHARRYTDSSNSEPVQHPDKSQSPSSSAEHVGACVGAGVGDTVGADELGAPDGNGVVGGEVGVGVGLVLG